MITEIELHNFKCFARKSLQLGALTLLSGLNSAGKSTVIQSFLLWEIARRGDGLVPLSGHHGLALGEALDVLYREAEERLITIVKHFGEADESLILELDDTYPLALKVNELSTPYSPDGSLGAYLSAERLGPRDALEVSALPEEGIGIGHQGQYVAQVIADRERLVVNEARRCPVPEGEPEPPKTVGSQSEAWLSTIVRPIQLRVQRLTDTSLTTLRFREPFVESDWLRPSNVGFGLSYALPIIVAGLTVDRGQLILIENPEAHLHPAGQSWMGEFLARVASDGVQVIVETHSDHVLNGVRRAVAVEGALRHEDLMIHFFGREGSTEIRVRGHGGLSTWPEYFFDQLENDLTSISRNRRSGR